MLVLAIGRVNKTKCRCCLPSLQPCFVLGRQEEKHEWIWGIEGSRALALEMPWWIGARRTRWEPSQVWVSRIITYNYQAVQFLFPTCQVRVVRFYQSCSPPPLPPHPPPPPPRRPDPSGHSRTSTASSRSQWAQPDLHRELQIPVGTAGPQPRLPGRSGHCRTSTATSRSQWALPDVNRAFRSQWALPDLNRDFQIAVGTAGPQREECEKRCQIECQKICQIECQKECQKRMSEKNVRRYARQNVRRYARKNVRRYVR